MPANLVAKDDRWRMYNDRGYFDYEDPYPLRYDATFGNGGDYLDPRQQAYYGQRVYAEGPGSVFPQHLSPHGHNPDYLGYDANRGADPLTMRDPIGDIGMRGRYGDLNHASPYDMVDRNGRFPSSPDDYASNYGDMRGQIYQDLRYAYDTDDPYMDPDYFPNLQRDPYDQFDGLPNDGFGYDPNYPMYGNDRAQQNDYAMGNQAVPNQAMSNQAMYGQGMREQVAYGQGMHDQMTYDPFAADRHGVDGLGQHMGQDPMGYSGPYGNPQYDSPYDSPHGNPYGNQNPYSQQYPDQYGDHAQTNQHPDHPQYQDQYKGRYQEGAAPGEMPFASEFNPHQGTHDAFNQYQQDQGQCPYQDMSAPMRPEMDFAQPQSQAYSMSSTGTDGRQTDQVSMSDFGQQYGQQPMQDPSHQMQNMPYEQQSAQAPMHNMQAGMPQYQQGQQYQQGLSDMQPNNPYGQQAMMQGQHGEANFQNDPNMGFGMQGAQAMQPNPMMQEAQGGQGMQGAQPDQMMQGAQFDPMMQNAHGGPMMQEAQPFNGQQPNGQMPPGQMSPGQQPNGQMSPGQSFDGQQPYMQQPDNSQFGGQPPVDGLQHSGANGGATKYLIFGILSIILGLIPPVGIVLAILTRRMVKKFRSNGGADSKADAANIFALVGLIFSIVVLVLIVVFVVLLLTGSAFALNIAYAFNQSPIGSFVTIPI